MAARTLAWCCSLLLTVSLVSADEPPPPRLDRTGDPLPEQALARLGTTRFRHGDDVACIAFSPDGKTIASLGSETIRLWNAEDGRLKHSWPESSGSFGTIAFSHDGTVLYTSGAQVQNPPAAPAGVPRVQRLGQDLMPIMKFRLSPNGRQAAALAFQGGVKLIDVASGGVQKEFNGFDHQTSLAFSPDGKTLATGGNDRIVQLWDVDTGKERHKIKVGGRVSAIEYLPDGAELLVAYDGWFGSQSIHAYDAQTAQHVRRVVSTEAQTMAISANGQYLAAGGFFGSIRVVDLKDTSKQTRIDIRAGELQSLEFSPDSRRLASAGRDSIIRIWDPATGKYLGDDHGHRGPVRGLAFTAKAGVVATGGNDGTVRFWDLRTGATVHRPFAAGQSISALTHLGEDRLGIVAGKVRVIDAFRTEGAEKPSGRNSAMPFPFDDAAFSLNGRFAIVGDVMGPIVVRETASGKVVGRMNVESEWPTVFAVNSTGRLAATSSQDFAAGNFSVKLQVWGVAAGKATQVFAFQDTDIGALSFLPDGRFLAAGGRDGKLCICDSSNGALVSTWTTANDDAITAIVPDANGRTIAAGCDSGSITIWERRTGLVRYQFRGHHGRIRSLQFSPDGRLLASGSDDTTALIWPIAPVAAGEAMTDADCKRLWDDLVSGDGGVAERAIWRFASGGMPAIDFLRQAMPPAAAVDPAKVARLIRQLNDAQFNVRQKAEQELSELADGAKASLQAALESKISAEQRERISALLDRLNETPQGDALRDIRAIEALERHGSPEARKLLEALAAGAAGRRLTEEAKETLARVTARK